MKVPSEKDVREFIKIELRNYIWHLFAHGWIVVVSILLAVVGTVSDMGGIDIPNWVWWVIFLGGLHIAQFMAYRDVRKERDALRRYDVAQAVLTELSRRRDQLISLQNERLVSEAEFGAWQQRHSTARSNLIKYLSDNVSEAEAKTFDRIGIFNNFRIDGKEYVNDNHITLVSQVIRDHQWLTSLILDYGRHRPRAQLNQELVDNGE